MILLICFVRIDFTEQYCIEGEKSGEVDFEQNISTIVFILDLTRYSAHISKNRNHG
jgi:hypothetical protein